MGSTDVDTFEAYLEGVLKEIAKRESIEDPKVCYKAGSLKGEGYLGIVNAVDVKGSNRDLNLIVKSANPNEAVRSKVPLGECVETELQFYDTVVPELKAFCRKRGVDGAFDGIPRSYWVDRQTSFEVIVLENLKDDGYDTWDRMKPMDPAHVEMILREYGRLHAISFAYKEKEPAKYLGLIDGLGDNVLNWMVKGKMMDTSVKLLTFSKTFVDEQCAGKLAKFIDEVPDFILHYDHRSDPLSAISHSDCWCNNMMFKYNDGSKTPQSAKLIDFQLTRSSSIICDLAHFLGTCADATVWNDLDRYLRVYHSSLVGRLADLGCTTVVTFERVKQEFNRMAKYGLVLSAFFMRVMFINPDEAPDIDAAVNDRFMEKFIATIENEHLYKERMKFLVEYFCKNNLI